MDLTFNSSRQNTIGVEVELQVINPETKELACGSPQIIQKAAGNKNIKQELFQSVIEINTGVCENIDELRKDLSEKLLEVERCAHACGFELASAATHPFSSWKDQLVYPDDRYNKILDNIQYLARRMLTFGLHVHVGVDNQEKAIYINNSLISFLPLIYPLSTSGPYWTGADSGLASLRPKIFETMPNAGLPSYLHCWHEYRRIIYLLNHAQSIDSFREIWWDVRPHPTFGTVEVRACDAPSTMDEIVAITALIQSLVAWLSDRYDNNDEVVLPPYMLVKENRWRSIRHGIEAELIDMSGERTPVKKLIEDLLEELSETSSRLNCSHEIVKVLDIFKNGTSSHRQRAIYQKTNSLVNVVEALIEELKSNTLTMV